jgi:hypothetical protein
MLNEYLPPCIVTDNEGRILYVSGDAGKYLRIPSGEINYSVYGMLPESIIKSLKRYLKELNLRNRMLFLKIWYLNWIIKL